MMKLGILDSVPPEFYEAAGVVRDTQRFITLLSAVGFDGEMIGYHVAANEFPPSLDACDAYLITGSPASAYEDHEWIHRLMEFIRAVHSAQKRLVGVCFGHQVIAQALGGKVMKSPGGWQAGLYEFNLLQKQAWMNGTAQSSQAIRIYHLNKDQVMQLPAQAKHLGESRHCKNSMYMIDKHILGIQGHPELPQEAITGYMEELGDALSPELVERAHRSFEKSQPDALLVGNWIREFIEQNR